MGLYVLKYPTRRLLGPLAALLAGVHPDVLSYMATVVTAGTALCYLWAVRCPTLLLWAIGLTLLRMVLNTLDGVLAIRRGNLTLKGEIVNALPDRFSDIFLLLGIALSPLCRPMWGMLGLCSMLLVSYTGMLGKALGVDWQHHGPLGKVERLILLMVCSLVQYLQLHFGWATWSPAGYELTAMELGMVLFVVLGPLTVLNRTRGMLRQIARLEWNRRGAEGHLPRVLVAYDSATGNTRKVADALAESFRTKAVPVEGGLDAGQYDLVVIGSPVISGKPTEKVMQFLRRNREMPNYALFVTYGAPIIGPGRVRRALACARTVMRWAPLGSFVSKGRHAMIPTYRSRPNDDDLLRAFKFGVKLAQLCGRTT